MDKSLKVIKVVDEFTVVINAGSMDGIKGNFRFIIYRLGTEDLIDPDTQENLGKLEMVKGVAVPTHIQEKVTTLKSDIWKSSEGAKTILRKSPFSLGTTEEVVEHGNKTREPFDDPRVGDLVKIRN